jgi:hypothetical protein
MKRTPIARGAMWAGAWDRPLVTRVFAFCGDVLAVLALGLSLPVAILLVGSPVALVVRLLLEAFARL